MAVLTPKLGIREAKSSQTNLKTLIPQKQKLEVSKTFYTARQQKNY